MINSQLVLAEVTVDATTLESIVKAALVATLSYVTSPDQIVAFSVVSSRRRRLQQSTTTVSFSVRVEGSTELAAGYAETIVSELSAAAQSGALTQALATAADDASVEAPTARAADNDYDTIMAATAVDGAPAPTARPTPQPVTAAPSTAPSARPTEEKNDRRGIGLALTVVVCVVASFVVIFAVSGCFGRHIVAAAPEPDGRH